MPQVRATSPPQLAVLAERALPAAVIPTCKHLVLSRIAKLDGVCSCVHTPRQQTVLERRSAHGTQRLHMGKYLVYSISELSLDTLAFPGVMMY